MEMGASNTTQSALVTITGLTSIPYMDFKPKPVSNRAHSIRISIDVVDNSTNIEKHGSREAGTHGTREAETHGKRIPRWVSAMDAKALQQFCCCWLFRYSVIYYCSCSFCIWWIYSVIKFQFLRKYTVCIADLIIFWNPFDFGQSVCEISKFQFS